jgi:NADH-quinone oxidoreductase subunit N
MLCALQLFAALGMILLAAAASWVVLVLGLELYSLCFYVLIGLDRARRSSLEAALKYFVPGAVAAGCLVFGVALVYAATGSLTWPRAWPRPKPWPGAGLAAWP